jgi:hypothetical protein
MYEGIHIVSMVKQSIRGKIKRGEITIPKIDINIVKTTSFFDRKNITKNAGMEVVSIDFRRCYWTTLHRLEYIDEKLYKTGLKEVSIGKDGNEKKVNYKLACNMSIGSLGVKEHFEKYVDGVLIESGVRRCELNPIRLHVISEVFNVAISIINKNKAMKDGFLWFLTDCFFVTKDVALMYEDAIKESGYECKPENYERYELSTRFVRDFGYMKYFVKWGGWELELAKTFNFSKKNEIGEMIKNVKLWTE